MIRIVLVLLIVFLLNNYLVAQAQDPCGLAELETGGGVHAFSLGEELFATITPNPLPSWNTPSLGATLHIRSTIWSRSGIKAGFLDVDKDGLMDRVCIGLPQSSHGSLHKIYLATKEEVWAQSPIWQIRTPIGSWFDENYVDVNADGCPDYVTAEFIPFGLMNLRTISKVRVFLCNPAAGRYETDYVQLVREKGHFSTKSGLYDLNGDGLPEMIFLDVLSDAATVSGLVADIASGGIVATIYIHEGKFGIRPFDEQATAKISFKVNAMSLPSLQIDNRQGVPLLRVSYSGDNNFRYFRYLDGKIREIQ